MALNELVPGRFGRRPGPRPTGPSAFERMHEEMDRLFDDFMPQFSTRGLSAPASFGSVDLTETDNGLELQADLPGMEEKDIDITLRNGALVINAERRQESEEKKKNFYRSERVYGAVSRTIPLPYEVEEDKIDARFHNGVLTVQLPKSGKVLESERKIPIHKA